MSAVVVTSSLVGRVLTLPVDFAELDTYGRGRALADAGMFVFPLRGATAGPDDPDGWKEPLLRMRWSVESSRDQRQIAAWFSGTSGLGIGIDCGKSGLVVVDIDHAGIIEELLEPSLTVTTGKGRHVYYLAPEDRRLGNSTGTLPKGFGDIRGAGGLVVAAGSPHASGCRYEFEDITQPIVPLPTAIAERLDESEAGEPAATSAETEEFLDQHSRAITLDSAGSGKSLGSVLCSAMVRRARSAVDKGASRHVTAVGVLKYGLREAAAGYYAARPFVDELADWFAEVKPEAASDEWVRMVAWAVAQARNADPDETRAEVEASLAQHDLRRLWWALDTYLESYDPLPVLASLATAATSDLDGEPLWLLIVGPPSGGKTEAVRLIERSADEHIGELTGAAALLSWTKGKNPKPSGVLARLAGTEKATATIRDLSPLLASSDRGGRDEVYSKLRDIYDGRCRREVGQNPQPLEWSGRLTVLAAVTPAIDNYASHARELGDRWLYLRMRQTSAAVASRKAMRSLLIDADKIAEGRAKAQWVASDIIERGRKNAASVDLSESSRLVLAEAAVMVSRARAVVPRHGYGRREIDGVPIVEEVPRIARQLGLLVRGLVAIGLDEGVALNAGIRAAVESVPPARRELLIGLAAAAADGELPSTSELSRSTGLHRHVVRMQLEELALVGMVRLHGHDDVQDENSTKPKRWSLALDGEAAGAPTVLARYSPTTEARG